MGATTDFKSQSRLAFSLRSKLESSMRIYLQLLHISALMRNKIPPACWGARVATEGVLRHMHLLDDSPRRSVADRGARVPYLYIHTVYWHLSPPACAEAPGEVVQAQVVHVVKQDSRATLRATRDPLE